MQLVYFGAKWLNSALKAIATLIAIIGSTENCCPEYCNPECRLDGAACVRMQNWCGLEAELPIIRRAAERNGCRGEDFFILLAVRKAENGAAGREFGVLHPICQALIKLQPQKSLDIQAGWAAATIVKNRSRWIAAGRCGDFIDFLAARYCPASADAEGNKNWRENVKYWYGRFKSQNKN